METSPSSKGYAGSFGADIMLKDLGPAQENAATVRASTPLVGMARNLYAAHRHVQPWGAGLLQLLKLFRKP